MKDHCKEIIAIGDIHGRRCWEEIVKRHPDAHFVFLGDYCDPYDNFSQKALLENLNRIIELKRSHTEQVTLLLGNHDLHYFVPGFPMGSRYDRNIAKALQQIFTTERELFAYAYETGNLLFTHAGISQGWLDACWKLPFLPSLAQCLNHPENMEDKGTALYTCGPSRMGPDPAGGIFWADEDELEIVPTGVIQIVGHNGMNAIRHIHSRSAEKNVMADLLICDCLEKFRYLRIELTNEEKYGFYEMNLRKKTSKFLFEANQTKEVLHNVDISYKKT